MHVRELPTHFLGALRIPGSAVVIRPRLGFSARDDRRSQEWRWPGRYKATNRIPGVKGVLENRIEIDVPGSQTSCNRLIPYAVQRAEGIPETVYRSLVFMWPDSVWAWEGATQLSVLNTYSRLQ